MKNIYKGPVRKVVVSKLDVSEGLLKIAKYETPIIKEDILFYRGLFNSYVSFDYNTVIPDKNEALDFITRIIEEHNITEEPFPDCSFVDKEEINFSHQISKEEFKALKKEYKMRRKMAQQKKK